MSSLSHIKVRIVDVVDAVIEVSKIPHRELIGARRWARVVYWRQVAYVASVYLTGQSTVAIGRHFDRDHSTVVYAKKKARLHLCNSPAFVADIFCIAERAIAIAEARGYVRRAA